MKKAFVAAALALTFSVPGTFAANKYWDINSTTAGAGGATPSGNISGTTFWNPASDGTGTTAVWSGTTDTAVFSAGTDATGSYTVTINSGITAAGIIVEDGTVNLAGTGAITIGTNPITVASGKTLSIDNVARLSASAGSSMTLNGGTFRNTATTSGGTFVSSNIGIVLGSGGGTVSANGGSNIVSIYTGLISGTGPLTIAGSGKFRLTTTTATYSGATIISGNLQISTTANVLPSLTPVTINSGGSIDLQNALAVGSLAGSGTVTTAGIGAYTLTVGADDSSTTYSGIVAAGSGDITLTKTGAGTMIISSNDWTNTGNVNVNGGTIKFGNSAAGFSNSSTVTVASGATLDMNSINDTFGMLSGAGSVTNNSGTTGLTIVGTNSTTFSGSITGTSSLTKSSASTGTTTLSGNNTLDDLNINAGIFTVTGSNTINGSVNIAGAGTLSASSGRINFNNSSSAGSAQVNVSGPGAEISSNVGSGTITTANQFNLNTAPTGLTDNNRVQIQVASGGTWTLTGSLTGVGGLIRDDNGSGTLNINGNNSFSGGFYITSRAVRLGNQNALGTGTFTIGDPSTAPANSIAIRSTANLTGSSAISNAVTVNRDFTIEGSSGFELSGGMALSGARTITVTNSGVSGTILSGIISGSGASLTKAGGETLRLSGANSYTGATTISAGTLQIGNGGTTGSLSTNSAITNNGNLAFNRTNTVTQGTDFSGSAITGTGSLTQAGSGTLVLSAANTYSGGTSINSGTLTVTNSSGSGTGTGNITITNPGTLQIGNGGTTGALSTSGTITNNGNLTINRSNDVDQGNDFSSSAITGSGSLTKLGAGTLVLTAANNYSGGTTVSGGILQGNATSVQGNITNNAQVTFVQSSDGTYAGNMSGSGNLSKTGGGKLTLSGTNSYSGGTTVATGTLEGTTTSLQGNITNSNTLNFNQATNGTYAGSISGAGNVNKQGAGQVTFTGNSTYSGDTTVSGELRANNDPTPVNATATGTGQVTVNADGTLSGTGSVGATGKNVIVNGTLSPGETIESLKVFGTLSFSSSSLFAVEINSSAMNLTEAADLVTVRENLNIDPAAQLDVDDLGSTPLAAGTKLTLISYINDSWNNTETFAGWPNMHEFTVGPNTFVLQYNDTSPGNSFQSEATGFGYVTLTVTAVPEASVVLFGCLLSAGLYWRFTGRKYCRS